MSEQSGSTPLWVTLLPSGRRVQASDGGTLMEVIRLGGIDLAAVCGGMGTCGTCRVRLLDGALTEITPAEKRALSPQQLKQGYRLACQARALSDVRLEIPPESALEGYHLQLEGHETAPALDPLVIAVDLTLPPADLNDQRADLSRLNDALRGRGFADVQACPSAAGQLAKRLRNHNWQVRVALRRGDDVTRLVSTQVSGNPLAGLAVDVGSTKLAIYLVSLESGATLASAAVMNPQVAYGEDVVSRIAFANQKRDHAKLLQRSLVETINDALEMLSAKTDLCKGQIVDAVMVGNTAMHHFLCDLPVEQLGAAPYVPVISAPLEVPADEVGLKAAPGTSIYLPPNIAGYVGGDHTAALLTLHDDQPPGGVQVLVDIGTNTEISLLREGEIVCCSTASGPAFEGAHIRDGMRAASGAIDRVWLKADGVKFSTLNDAPPLGICGTGILSAVDGMLGAGILDRRGALRATAPGVRRGADGLEFLLAPAAVSGHGRDIAVTRRDVNEIQLAKGAIRAGIEILLQEAGLKAQQVDRWVIAGAFGTYLDVGSAQRVGMFPAGAPPERFQQVGNAAGVGAKQMLLSRKRRATAAQIVRHVRYLELTTDARFTDTYMKAIALEGAG